MSTTGENLNECDHCGARLPPADQSGTRTCMYCGSTYKERTAESTPQYSAPPTSTPYPGTSAQPFQPINADAKRAAGCGGGLAIFIILITLAGVLVPLYFVFWADDFDFGDFTASFSTGSGQGDDPTEAYVPMPGEPSGPVPFVAIARSYDGDTVYEVVKVDGVSEEPVWRSQEIGEWVYKHPLTSDPDRVYTADGSTLLAFSQADGSTVWQASLTDAVNNTELGEDDCTACFAVVGNTFVVRTKDGEVQAFDPATGAPAWNRRMQDTNAPVMSAAGRVVLVDGTGGNYSVSVVDPATGADILTFTPQCANTSFSDPDSLSASDPVVVSPDGTQLTAVFGTFATCVSRYDLGTGGLVWNAYFDEGSSITGSSFGSVEGDGKFAFSGGREMAVVDLATGVLTPINLEDDLSAYPLQIAAGKVLVTTESTRGTTSYGILALDMANGATTWAHNLGEVAPADPPFGSGDETVTDGSAVFTAYAWGPTLRVVTFDGSSKDLTVTPIDLASGAVAPATTLETGDTSLIPGFGPAIWFGNRLMVRAGDDALVTVDTDQPAITFQWP